MSSETPADRPSASSELPGEARPRRALDQPAPEPRSDGGRENDQTPSGGRNWSWDLPPTPDAERPQWGAAPSSEETGESDFEESRPDNPRPPSADAWLTALQPPTEFSEHPTELVPTVPQREDAPTGPDPATGAKPAENPPESGAEPAGLAGLGAAPNAEAATEQPGQNQSTREQQQPGQQEGRGRTGKKGGRKGALGLKGRQRFKLMQSVGPRTPRPDVPDQSHLPADQRTDLAVRVTDLSITYRTSFEKKPTLRQAVVRFGRGQRAVREIKALQKVSFEVRTGRSVGIIGRNGAGKSTLMRAMAGILPPTAGTVEVWGRASTLLALGVGFNNSLSGRENIILGGLASGLGLDEVEDRANEIAEWTELGDFIDMPMRTYSSGMASRVAFAVAVHMEPDILMIDEGLSTGDAHFKDKASAKMSELRDKARAMFLVSHGLGSIKELCDEAIWIDKGHLMARGEPEEVVEKYLHHIRARRQSTTFEDV